MRTLPTAFAADPSCLPRATVGSFIVQVLHLLILSRWCRWWTVSGMPEYFPRLIKKLIDGPRPAPTSSLHSPLVSVVFQSSRIMLNLSLFRLPVLNQRRSCFRHPTFRDRRFFLVRRVQQSLHPAHLPDHCREDLSDRSGNHQLRQVHSDRPCLPRCQYSGRCVLNAKFERGCIFLMHVCVVDFDIVSGGTLEGVSGTSCASPTFASVIGLINDRLIAAGKAPLGFLNPL